MTPTLVTERLILRPVDLGDASRIAALTNDPKVAAMLGDAAFPNTPARAEGRIFLAQARAQRGLEHRFAIDLPGEGLIGEASVSLAQGDGARIGYWLARAQWGQGYGAEALGAISRFAETATRGGVRAFCAADDAAAQQACERAGLTRTAAPREDYCLIRRASVERVEYRLAG
jgi:RimJ/RimL family protein N-acetyltransferase